MALEIVSVNRKREREKEEDILSVDAGLLSVAAKSNDAKVEFPISTNANGSE